MSPRDEIFSSWEPLPKVIEWALEKFSKQALASAEHIKEQWDKASALDYDGEG